MEKTEALIYKRTDLVPSHANLPLEEISCEHLRESFIGDGFKTICQANLIVFIDDDYKTSVLKSRWGIPGVVR